MPARKPEVTRTRNSAGMLPTIRTIEMQDFLQGHKGGIAQVYSTNRELPPDIVEAMRRAYASVLPYLETAGSQSILGSRR